MCHRQNAAKARNGQPKHSWNKPEAGIYDDWK